MTLKNKEIPPPRAPWRDLFDKQRGKAPVEFCLATVHHDPFTGRAYPRARTCIFRNFWSEIELHPAALREMDRSYVPVEPPAPKEHRVKDGWGLYPDEEEAGDAAAFEKDDDDSQTQYNFICGNDECGEYDDYDGIDARFDDTYYAQEYEEDSDDSFADLYGNNDDKATNEASFESDMFTFTTDVRMPKVGDLIDPDGGPGGYVEAVFWLRDVCVQWRVKGRAFVVGGDPEDEAEVQAREEIEKAMRACPGYSKKTLRKWSWEKEITAQFANLKPLMRAQLRPYLIPSFVLSSDCSHCSRKPVETGEKELFTDFTIKGHSKTSHQEPRYLMVYETPLLFKFGKNRTYGRESNFKEWNGAPANMFSC
ncbi:predicted protein [Uncinocarpus reesii 1704]|uniref:Pyridoxamine 5'-phosphate oxidase Alr4036 family FMN-binding domain-containing protein n=1 Tax=Uncinocarpus reesii (strain UAMH 1704) TaxID=336963 RepID=C4JDB9_UNCRE|nr:uncharacterized protein UREG_00679 [Uncinocarpus reesii 1704]EEP75832.1 predicted protein [Uncinocarpus reesii 1704]